jgi:hypothetical protein
MAFHSELRSLPNQQAESALTVLAHPPHTKLYPFIRRYREAVGSQVAMLKSLLTATTSKPAFFP